MRASGGISSGSSSLSSPNADATLFEGAFKFILELVLSF